MFQIHCRRVLQPIITTKRAWIFHVKSPAPLDGPRTRWLIVIHDSWQLAHCRGHNLVPVCWWQCEGAASNRAVIGHYSCEERLKASLPVFVLTFLFYSHHTPLHFPSILASTSLIVMAFLGALKAAQIHWTSLKTQSKPLSFTPLSSLSLSLRVLVSLLNKSKLIHTDHSLRVSIFYLCCQRVCTYRQSRTQLNWRYLLCTVMYICVRDGCIKENQQNNPIKNARVYVCALCCAGFNSSPVALCSHH